jgi:hypothetical protein
MRKPAGNWGALALLAACFAPSAPAFAQSQCPTEVDPGAFLSTAQLEQQLAMLAGLGMRATGSPTHHQYIDWIKQQLDAIPGMQRRDESYQIKRWLEEETELTIGASENVRVSSAVPYSTQRDPANPSAPFSEKEVTAELVYVPKYISIDSIWAQVQGKIILRDAPLVPLPRAGFVALAWSLYDPDGELAQEPLDTMERDVMGVPFLIDDLKKAKKRGAKGIIFMHDFPHEQMIGHYAPYEGVRWEVPGLFVGVDEGERLKQVAGSNTPVTLRVRADEDTLQTPNVIATLPGESPVRIVLNCHTDGSNALQDNGPIAMLAIARYFAALPIACRPKTLQFNFPTAHAYQQLIEGAEREGGAEQIAKQLDRDFEDGTVAYVISLEHLGALEYEAYERATPEAPNLPGRELRLSGRDEMGMVFVSTSSRLLSEVSGMLERHDNRFTFVMRGADLPGLHLPVHRSFAGEGTPYNQHLLPTVGFIAAPWTLLNPMLNLASVSPQRMRNQIVMFTDLIQRTAPRTVTDLAGGVIIERQLRAIACANGTPGEGTHCL